MHLQMLWIGIWLHTHTITITSPDIPPDLGVLADILGDVSMETMSLRYGRAWKAFPTASRSHVVHI